MRKEWILLSAAALCAGLFLGVLYAPGPVGAASKEIIELQQDVTRLITAQTNLQRSVDEKHAILKTLIEQSLDSNNKLSTAMGSLERSVQGVQANTGARMDTISTQVQAIVDNLEDVKARIAKLNQQAVETQNVLQSLDAKLGSSGSAGTTGADSTGGTTPSQPPPSPDVLYSSAYRDYSGGKPDLAAQEFADYLKYYPTTDLASNAEFYLGEIAYGQHDYKTAIGEYDKVLLNYPKSFKLAAARLKKGLAYLELGQKASATRELREVVRRHPGSEEAKRAAAKLRELGAAAPR